MRADDHAARLARVRAELLAHRLPGLLVGSRANVAYLTGFRGSEGLALLTPEAIDLVVDARYYEQAAQEAPGARRVLVAGARYDEAIAGAVHAAGLACLAFEADHMTVAEHMALGRALPAVELVPSRGMAEVARAVKDAAEQSRIARAAAITSEAVAAAIATARPGMTERELAWAVEAGLRARGAEGLAFPVLVAAGPRAALPHPRPGERPLAAGDWVLVDAGAMVEGYRADMSRSFVLGEPTARQHAAWTAVRAALAAGLAAIQPGVTGHDVDLAVRRALRARGFDRGFDHDTGHGVGLELHEAPRLGPGSDDVLAPGMVVTVEPGLYEPGVGGLRLEELAWVGSEGAKLLTTAPLALSNLSSRPGSC